MENIFPGKGNFGASWNVSFSRWNQNRRSSAEVVGGAVNAGTGTKMFSQTAEIVFVPDESPYVANQPDQCART